MGYQGDPKPQQRAIVTTPSEHEGMAAEFDEGQHGRQVFSRAFGQRLDGTRKYLASLPFLQALAKSPFG